MQNRGWLVTFSGTGINLALGILYTWSMSQGGHRERVRLEGRPVERSLRPLLPGLCLRHDSAGRCQDKFGPRLTASIGGLLVGAGFVLCSTTSSYGLWLLGFGVLAGPASASATVCHAARAEVVSTVEDRPDCRSVVAGFGLAPVYLAPASQYLLGHYQIQKSMLILGIAFVAIVCGLAQLLVNPPPGYVAGPKPAPGAAAKAVAASAIPGEILRQPTFWLLWVIYFIGAGAGLMVIGSVSGWPRRAWVNWRSWRWR